MKTSFGKWLLTPLTLLIVASFAVASVAEAASRGGGGGGLACGAGR